MSGLRYLLNYHCFYPPQHMLQLGIPPCKSGLPMSSRYSTSCIANILLVHKDLFILEQTAQPYACACLESSNLQLCAVCTLTTLDIAGPHNTIALLYCYISVVLCPYVRLLAPVGVVPYALLEHNNKRLLLPLQNPCPIIIIQLQYLTRNSAPPPPFNCSEDEHRQLKRAETEAKAAEKQRLEDEVRSIHIC